MSNPNIHGATRILVGHCPDCGRPLAVLNNREVWPLVECDKCSWAGPRDGLINRVRLDARWLVSDEHGLERELRP